MRPFPLAIALICAAPLAACDLGTAPSTPTQQVTVSGFVGKGVFSDSIPATAAFQLVAPDSSGQQSGELFMAGDIVPPAGTYDLDNNHFPAGFSKLSVEFIHPVSGGTTELYQPAGGNMVLTSVAGDSIAGTLNFSMALAALCSGSGASLSCQQVIGSNKVLNLTGRFLVRRTGAASFPGA